MKNTTILTACALLAILTSCEMKDELLGKDSHSDTGALELALSIPNRDTDTRADNPDDLISAFEVDITDKENAENAYNYVYSEMPPTLTLPVGTYTVSAHTAGEIQTQMDAPYYGGNNDLTITQGTTSQMTVICKMMNTLIQINYGDDFLDTFKSWTITFDAGDDRTLIFTSKNRDANMVYWYIADKMAETITMNITATNNNNEEIPTQKKFTKSDADETFDDDASYFNGGDILNINLGTIAPGEEEDENEQVGIDVNVDISFAEDGDGDRWEIPVEDTTGSDEEEPSTPDDPSQGDGNITMQMPSDGHITYTLGGSDQPASADVQISVPKGLKSMNVKIIAGNEGFEKTISDLSVAGLDFMTNGVEMVGNNLISGVLGAFLQGSSVSAPAEGDTSYTFPVGAFFGLMNGYGATAPNAHVFKIVIEDKEGNKIEDELQVTINPAA